MTSEEIIQRLLDEKKITVKEAMTLIIDTCKYLLLSRPKKDEVTKDYPSITVMYGITPVDYKQDNTCWSSNTYDAETKTNE